MKSFKNNIILMMILSALTFCTHTKAMNPIKGNDEADREMQRLLSEKTNKKIRINNLNDPDLFPLQGKTQAEHLAEAEKRENDIQKLEKEIQEIDKKLKDNWKETAKDRIDEIIPGKFDDIIDSKKTPAPPAPPAPPVFIPKKLEHLTKDRIKGPAKRELPARWRDEKKDEKADEVKVITKESEKIEAKKNAEEKDIEKDSSASEKKSSIDKKSNFVCPLVAAKKNDSCPHATKEAPSCPFSKKSSTTSSMKPITKGKHVSQMTSKERKRRRKKILKSKKKISDVKNRKNKKRKNKAQD